MEKHLQSPHLCSETPGAAPLLPANLQRGALGCFHTALAFCVKTKQKRKIWIFLSTETSHSLLQIKFPFLLFSFFALKPK